MRAIMGTIDRTSRKQGWRHVIHRIAPDRSRVVPDLPIHLAVSEDPATRIEVVFPNVGPTAFVDPGRACAGDRAERQRRRARTVVEVLARELERRAKARRRR